MNMALAERLSAAVQKFTKWRSVFAGWQLGARAMSDPEAAAVRDHRELSMLLRAEINAITGLLLQKKVFTQDELHEQLLEEIAHLEKAYERKFPGFESADYGMKMDVTKAASTMKGWP